jgi:glucose/arabinose dehydrogenase
LIDMGRRLHRPAWLPYLWHLVIVCAMVVVPAWLVFTKFPWALHGANGPVIAAMAAAYVVSVFGARTADFITARSRPFAPALALSLGLAVAYLALLMSTLEYSRKLLLLASLIAVAGVSVPLLFERGPVRWFMAGTVALIATVGFALHYARAPQSGTAEPDTARKTLTLQASQHILSATYFAGYVPAERGTRPQGGAVAADPSRPGSYLLVTPHGRLYRFGWGVGDVPALVDLNVAIPINRAEFETDAADEVNKAAFRVADLATRRTDSGLEIYVSHHYWRRARKCYVVRVSTITLAVNDDRKVDAPAAWRTVFESRPCLTTGAARGAPFAGEQIGGNLEFLDERRLLLTVGDHQFDGWYRPVNHVEDPDAHYGKTVVIDLLTSTSATFSTGHRNPQGLAVDSAGRIWETEHGPQGGDELNLLRPGVDYGYPRHTYGTEYGSTIWPPGEAAASRPVGMLPTFAWVPSIGISELVVVDDLAFPRWKGDLLIASLRGRAVFRVRLDGDRVAYVEPIVIGERVRDIAGGTGEFVLWTDNYSFVRLRAVSDLDDGAALFALRCGGCHDDKEHRIGPHLKGLFGRPIAGSGGYFGYSAGLRSLKGSWTEEAIDRFLADPQAFAPGTTMATDRMDDSKARKMLIEYIKFTFQ